MSTAAWPTSVQTIAHMYVAVNELQNNLNGSITSGATTLTLNSSTNFPTYGTVLIDNEVILYTGISGNDLTGLTRGFDSPNSVAAAHANGAVVSFAIVADHHNILAAEINAIESSLNLTASQLVITNASGRLTTEASPSLTEIGYLAGVTSAIQTQINAKGTGTVTSVTGTTNQIDVATGTTTPVLSISSTFVFPGTINANSQKITNLTNGSAAQDAAAFGQIYAGFQAPVQATSTTVFSTTSSTYQNTNLAATITPTSSSHRIKISVSGTLRNTNSALTTAFLSVKRGTTEISPANAGFIYVGGTGPNAQGDGSFTYIDSPATTSSTTYTVVLKNSDNATTVKFGETGSQVIILEEIV